jgi:hypothetical protein
MNDLEKCGKYDCWNYHKGELSLFTCRLGILAHAMKKSEDLHDVI